MREGYRSGEKVRTGGGMKGLTIGGMMEMVWGWVERGEEVTVFRYYGGV